MKRAIRMVLAAGAAAMLLGGCAAQPRTETAHRIAALAPVPDAGSGYQPIATTGAGGENPNIGIDFDKLGASGDLKLALMYGIDATASLTPDEGKPEPGVHFTGAGDSWKRPITVRGQAKALSTIANAYRFIADHFRGSRITGSTLYAGPSPSFVTRIAFGSDAGDQALYFDLTDWADAYRKEKSD